MKDATKLDPRSLTSEERGRLADFLSRVEQEVIRASRKFGKMHSTHEAYAVLLEEVDELWDEIKANNGTSAAAFNEAVQVSAMAARYCLDLFGEPASEPAKVECPNCGGDQRVGTHYVGWRKGGFTCKPARPEPDPVHVVYVCPCCNKQTATKQEHEIPIRDTGVCRFSCADAQPEPVVDCKHCLALIDERDRREEQINRIAEALGMDGADLEWSSGNDVGERCIRWIQEMKPETTEPEPVAAVYIDSPGGQRNRVLTDASDEPAAAEMPETVQTAGEARAYLRGFTAGEYSARKSAQPAKVRMTEELEKVLDVAKWEAHSIRTITDGDYPNSPQSRRGRAEADEIDAAIAAVRAQSAEAGAVRMPKVREFIEREQSMYKNPDGERLLNDALAELDAAEGVKG